MHNPFLKYVHRQEVPFAKTKHGSLIIRNPRFHKNKSEIEEIEGKYKTLPQVSLF